MGTVGVIRAVLCAAGPDARGSCDDGAASELQLFFFFLSSSS